MSWNLFSILGLLKWAWKAVFSPRTLFTIALELVIDPGAVLMGLGGCSRRFLPSMMYPIWQVLY